MIKVVLDMNILVSALWSSAGNPFKILNMFAKGEFTLYYSDSIANEYHDVLTRQRFNFNPEKVSKLLNDICLFGILIAPKPSDFPMTDETDRKFYDAAKTAGAILITGNIKHYPTESFIILPADFIQK